MDSGFRSRIITLRDVDSRSGCKEERMDKLRGKGNGVIRRGETIVCRFVYV